MFKMLPLMYIISVNGNVVIECFGPVDAPLSRFPDVCPCMSAVTIGPCSLCCSLEPLRYMSK